MSQQFPEATPEERPQLEEIARTVEAMKRDEDEILSKPQQ